MLLKIGVGFLAVFLGLLSAGFLALLSGGIATVYVEDDDFHLYLPLPMAAVDLALALVPERELASARLELAPHRQLVETLFEQLRQMEDAVLVDVRDHGETVIVLKEGDYLIVDVDAGPGERVKVKIPLRSVQRIAATIAG